MREFLRLLPIFFQRSAWQADALVKANAFLYPILMPQLPAPIRLWVTGVPGTSGFCHAAADGFDCFIRLDEELEFHLLELARAKREIPRRHFVAERLAHLRDAERDFLAGGFEDVFELREN